MTETILEIKHLKNPPENQVLKDISLTVHKGEVILLQPIKSTFLLLYQFHLKYLVGEIIYKGQNVLEPNYDLTHYREN